MTEKVPLSKPCSLAGQPGFAADAGRVAGAMAPGTACTDAPVRSATGTPEWLLNHLGGRPVAMVFVDEPTEAAQIEHGARECGIPGLGVLAIAPDARGARASVLGDPEGLVRARYGGARGVTYLIRPDQHVLARCSHWQPRALRAAWDGCLGSHLT